MAERTAFFRECLSHPCQVASIMPSSRFLERRVVAHARIDSAKALVELGPGTGGTTQAILRAMDADARLLSIEINPHFHTILGRIGDSRLTAHLGSADDLQETVWHYDLSTVDVVVSGIPFSSISRASGARILEQVSALLVPGGRFVAYQLSRRIETLCRPLLGPPQVSFELFNMPPLRVYCWEKQAKT
ncbi:MAG TPA: methyltransferase type 12 [Candidatus Hydrogenedentes bacterium]|nr:methyltransferase type 12 [Candidatus Hydrogenedentota bacterium]